MPGSSPDTINSDQHRQIWIIGLYGVVLCGALFLLLFQLDSRPLWGDEAETATLAKNTVRFGIPIVDDGLNYITLFGEGVDSNEDGVWIWSPWLQEYLAAASFLVFGPTTWASRMPFALAGWLCIVLLLFVAHRIYRSHSIALASALLLATSEVFLLHARQCRYYSVSVLGEILLIYAMHLFVTLERRAIGVLAGALLLLFYSNYILCAASLPALIPLALVLYRHDKSSFRRMAGSLGIFVAGVTPWLLYAKPWHQSQAIGHENFAAKAWQYLVEFHFHFVPLIALLLPIAGWLAVKYHSKSGAEMSRNQPVSAATILSFERCMLFLVVSYSGIIVFSPGTYLRYLLPILPVASLLVAAWVFRYVRRRAVAVGLIAIQCTTSAFSTLSAVPFGKVREQHALRSPLIQFVRGSAGPYANRFTDVLDYLRTEAKPADTLLVSDHEFPLVFYTQMAIIDANIFKPREGQLPDWILSDSSSDVRYAEPASLPDFLRPHYETITLQVHASKRADCFPEPDFYQYRTSDTREPFVIYRKKLPRTDQN